ncbi:hypothetical protein [Peterkaempfera bronchialis]|uniref:hypothetical protein n=1 Tax=Peterkaempfera bronchialis TaxID=2126346 RepID=UPI003C2E872F
MDAWLARAFAPHRLAGTVEAMARAAGSGTGLGGDAGVEEARRRIRDCEAKLARYRAALDAGGDPLAIAQWTNEVRARKSAGEAQLNMKVTPRLAGPSVKQIRLLVAGPGDMVKTLKDAAVEDKAAVYREVGIQGTSHPGKRQLRVEEHLDAQLLTSAFPRGVMVGVRGGT